MWSRIIGTGAYLPERILHNIDIEKMVETSDQWITERTGISQRHIIAKDETTSSMAANAAKKAIEMAGINISEIDAIIVATCTPDRTFPNTACILQKHLGITNNCLAFDVGVACAGFIYALDIADQYIRNGKLKNVLIVGSEAMSRIVDWADRSTCILFSDGAGAVVLAADNKPGILSSHIHANGEFKDLLYAPNHLGELNEPPYIRMKGNEVFKVAVNTLNAIVDETLRANNIDQSAIDWLVPHQANLRIIQATARRLNLSMDRVILTVSYQGNTSAASIPLALDVGVRDGRIKRGDTVLMEAFGAGFAWGSTLLVY